MPPLCGMIVFSFLKAPIGPQYMAQSLFLVALGYLGPGLLSWFIQSKQL
jgi:hypothetical protein